MDIDTTKQLLRSVLLSTKTGVRAQRLQTEFSDLAGSYIAHKDFGYPTLHHFILSLKDVVRVETTYSGDILYHAIADSSTAHIQKLVAGQKRKKVKPKVSSYSRNLQASRVRKNYKPTYNYKSSYGYKPSYYQKQYYGQTWQGNSRINNNYNSSYNNYNSYNNNGNKRPNSTNYTYNPMSSSTALRKTYSQPSQSSLQTSRPVTKYLPGASNQANTLNQPALASNQVRKVSALSAQAVQKAHLKEKLREKINVHNQKCDPPCAPTIAGKEKGDNVNNQCWNKAKVEQYKENLKKLLQVNTSGIHSNFLGDLYKKTFKESLPQNVIDAILSGQLSGIIRLESYRLNGKLKQIVFPLPSEKADVGLIKPKPLDKQAMNISVARHKALEVGKVYDVVISCFFDCDELYIQLVSEAEQYKELSKEIKAEKGNHVIKPGMYVITPLNMRAKVLTIKADKALIYDIDVGTSHQMAISDLTPMSASVADPDEFAICCSLHRPDSVKWNPVSDKFFEESLLDLQLRMKVVSVSCVTNSKESLVEHSVVFCHSGQNLNAKAMKFEKEFLIESAKNAVDPTKFQPKSFVDLPKTDFFNLFILNAPCTTEIEACIIGEGYTDKLAHLETLMKEYYSGHKGNKQVPSSYPIDCVYAVLSADNYVRGRLISISNNKATVYLVDNGEYETVNLSSLRALLEEFTQLPMQSMLVGLAGLDCTMLSNHCDILNYLNKEVVHNTFAARLVGQVTTSTDRILHMVDLINVNQEKDVFINEVCVNLVMNKDLIPLLPEDCSFFDFIISHVVEKENLVYVQHAGEGMKYLQGQLDRHLTLMKMNKNLTKEFAHGLYAGKICLAVIGSSLHRVQVLELCKDGVRDVVVFLIDVGRKEKVSRCKLFKLDSGTLFCIPRQAVCCKVSDENLADESEGKVMKLSDIVSRLDKAEGFQLRQEFKVDAYFHIKLYFKAGGSYYRVLPIAKQQPPATPWKTPKKKLTPAEKSTQSLTERFAACTLTPERNLYLVKVLKAESPSKIQMITEENLKQRERLLEDMNTHYQTMVGTMAYIDHCIIGKMYAMLHVENQMPNWYRVRVESKMDDLVSVYLVDYGTFMVLKEESCKFRILEKIYTDGVPDMVWFAKLGGVTPIFGSEWPREVANRFSQLISYKSMYCDTVQVMTDPNVEQRTLLLVALCDTSNNKDVWINDLLVDNWKCARYLA